MTSAKILGLSLIVVYIAALKILNALGTSAVFEHPLLLFIMNTLFTGVLLIAVAYIAGKVFVGYGSPTTLFFGCGMLSFGLSAISAGLMIWDSDGANLNVTVYNTGGFLGSAFHALGMILSVVHVDQVTNVRRFRRVAFAYAGITLFVLCFSAAGLKGYIPPFFRQGVGPTELRQAILGSSILLYAFSSIVLMAYYLRGKSDFLYWYSLSLAMLAIGLFAFFIQKSVGSPIGWLGRSANYIGGIFAAVAVVGAMRDAKIRGGARERSFATLLGDLTPTHKAGFLRVLPIPVCLVLLAILAALNLKGMHEPPASSAALNTLFLTILPVGVVYFATRSYLRSGLFSMLMLGCAALTLALSGVWKPG